MSNLCNGWYYINNTIILYLLYYSGVQPSYWKKLLKVLPKFSKLIYSDDDEILKDVCWSLSCISSGTKDRIKALVHLDSGISKRLVELLL